MYTAECCVEGHEAVDAIAEHLVLVGEHRGKALEAVELSQHVHCQHQPVTAHGRPPAHRRVVQDGVQIREEIAELQGEVD